MPPQDQTAASPWNLLRKSTSLRPILKDFVEVRRFLARLLRVGVHNDVALSSCAALFSV